MSLIQFPVNNNFTFTGGASFPKIKPADLLKGNTNGDFLTLTPVNTQPVEFTKLNLVKNQPEVVLQRPLPLKVPSYDAVNAVLEGIYKKDEYFVRKEQIAEGLIVSFQGYSNLKRSEKLTLQTLAEQSEHSLNQKISNILEKTGITPAGNGKLDFSLDQNGLIQITGGIEDSEQKHILENIFNADEELKQELMIYQARKSVLTDKCAFTPQTNAVIFDVYEKMNGRNPDEGVRKSEYIFNFSFQNGSIFQGEAPKDSIFNNRLDSLAGLAEVIGIAPENTGSVQSFAEELQNNINGENTVLTEKINAVLKQSGLEDLTRKITFSSDENGDIIVEGNIRRDKLKQLQQNINADSELTELLKKHKAKQDILAELQQAFQDEPNLSGVKTEDEWAAAVKEYNTRKPGFDLSKDELAFARAQFGEDNNANSGTTPLASFKRGALGGTEESANIDESAESLRKKVAGAIKKYNDTFGKYNADYEIADWSLTLDKNGNTVIDIKTKGGNADDNQRAEHFINFILRESGGVDEIANAIFEAHDDEHGDVKEYKHQFVLTKDGYSIESPEADKAALAEMQTIGNEIFCGLSQYFNSMFGSGQQFGFILNDDGKLSPDAESREFMFANKVNNVLELLNDIDNPNRILPDELKPIAEKMLDYQEAAGKLHTNYSFR